MTLLVGILCQKGVVVAADQAITFAAPIGNERMAHTISHRACKIVVLQNQVIVAGTGQLGMNQRFCDTVATLWDGGQLKGKSPLDVARLVAVTAAKDFNSTRAHPGSYGALLAFPSSKHGPTLFEFPTSDFQPEMKDTGTWFVSMGSGQLIADSYLAFIRNVYWQDGTPTLQHGLFAAAWVMHQSISVAPGLIAAPIDIAVLEGSKAKKLDTDEVAIHLDAAEEATKHFRKFDPLSLPAKGAVPEPPPAIPEPPKS